MDIVCPRFTAKMELLPLVKQKENNAHVSIPTATIASPPWLQVAPVSKRMSVVCVKLILSCTTTLVMKRALAIW